MELVVLKDRPGQVRAHSQKTGGRGKAQVAGVVTLDSRTEGRSSLVITPPRRTPSGGGGTLNADGEDVNDAERRVELDFTDMPKMLEKIAQRQDDEEIVLGAFRGEIDTRLNSRDLFAITDPDLPRGRTKAALDRLISRGWLLAYGGRGGREYILVAEGVDGPVERDLDESSDENGGEV